MRGLADKLAAAGKPIQDDELISYILHGLDLDYQPLVSALDAHVTPISLNEIFSMLSNFDHRMAQFHGAGGGGFKSSGNAASHGRGGGPRSRGTPRNKGRSGSSGNGGGQGRGGGSSNKGRRGGGSGKCRPDTPRCQICGKLGHTAKDCRYRYEDDDESSQDDDKVVATADGSYGVDTNWYVDSGATYHITSEMEKVTMKDKYRGKDQIHTASGEGNDENPLSR